MAPVVLQLGGKQVLIWHCRIGPNALFLHMHNWALSLANPEAPGISRLVFTNQGSTRVPSPYLSRCHLALALSLSLSLSLFLSLLVFFCFLLSLASCSPFNQEAPIKCDVRRILYSWSFFLAGQGVRHIDSRGVPRCPRRCLQLVPWAAEERVPELVLSYSHTDEYLALSP